MGRTERPDERRRCRHQHMRRTRPLPPPHWLRQYAQRNVERYPVFVQQARGVRDPVSGAGVQHGIDEHGGYAVMAAIHRSLPEGSDRFIVHRSG
jgi:hypothetical protein